MAGMHTLKMWGVIAVFAALFAGAGARAEDFPDFVPGPGLTNTGTDAEIIINDGTVYEIVADVVTDNTENKVDRVSITGDGSGLVVGSDAWTTGTGKLSVSRLDINGGTGVTGTLPGSYSSYAVLGVNNGKTLGVDTMTVGDSVWVAIGDQFGDAAPSYGTLIAGTLTLNGADSEVWVGTGSLLDAETLTLSAGTLDNSGQVTVHNGMLITGGELINSGTLDAVTGFTARGTVGGAGNDPVIRLTGVGTITANADKRLDLYDEAALEVEGTNSITGGILTNTSGYVHVAAGAGLNVANNFTNASDDDSNDREAGLVVDGILDVGGTFANSGTAVVKSSGRLNADDIKMTGGSLTVNADGVLDGVGAGTFEQSGGTTDMNGTMQNFGNVAVSGGTLNLGGTLTGAADITQTGGTANISGALGTGTTIASSGGDLILRGGGQSIADLAVYGTADVSVETAVTTGTFSMGGNSAMTLTNSGLLHVTNGTNPLSLGGVWNLNGGSATFDNGVDVAFSASGRLNANADSSITLIGDGAGPNTAVFSLNGHYHVGDDIINTNDYATLTVRGAETFSVGAGATVSLGGNASRTFQQDFDTVGLDMLILDTDALASDPTQWGKTLIDSNNSARYTYEVKADTITGEYGLYVTDVDVLSRAEQRANLLAAWAAQDRVGENAGRLLNDSFIDAVLDGNAIYLGHLDAAADYDDLDAFGQFNAKQLSGMMNPGGMGAGYDALMLYNGSGLTMVNEAVINTNRRLLARVNDRAGVLRREEIVDEVDLPDGVTDPAAMDALSYGPPRATRIWAEGLYHSDISGARDGFAGYEYRGTGLMIGADKREDNVWYGGTLAYVGGDYGEGAALSSSSDIATYAALLFAGLKNEYDYYANGAIGYAYSDVGLADKRMLNGAVGTNKGDFGTHSFLLGLEGGRDFRVGDYFVVTPSAGLSYVYARGGAHDQWFEGSGGGLGTKTLTAGEITGSSLTVPLNLAVSMDVFGDDESLLSVTGKMGYAYEILDRGAKGRFGYGGLGMLGDVDAVSRKPGQHTWNFGLSARYLYQDLEFGFGYDYIRRDAYNSHNLSISAGMNF